MIHYDKHKKALYIVEVNGGCRKATLRPKEYGIWELLARHQDEAVSRKMMSDDIWGGRYVTDFTINQTINQLRRKIGEAGKDVVITVPRQGYALNSRFITTPPPNIEDINSVSESSICINDIVSSSTEDERACQTSLKINRWQNPSGAVHCHQAPSLKGGHQRKETYLLKIVRRLCESIFKS